MRREIVAAARDQEEVRSQAGKAPSGTQSHKEEARSQVLTSPLWLL